MTFSIVASDLGSGDWGVAVASKFPAVGAVVPHARAGAGAVATQALANVGYGPAGLDLLAAGRTAEATLRTLTEGDEDRRHRQVGVVDATGAAATFTGDACMPWAGGLTGSGFACQGNILTGLDVVEAMADAFRSASGDLVDRLLGALRAGDAAGGDRRGKQSAALLVVRAGGGYGGRSDRYVDLRVDDHLEPVEELARVFAMFDRDVLVRHDTLLPVSAALVEELQRRLRAAGYLDGEITGTFDAATREGLEAFAGEYNLEGRLRIDDLVSEALVRDLREITGDVAPAG
jgi:uncharacterized Ntn-hydrolase superfamily protein